MGCYYRPARQISGNGRPSADLRERRDRDQLTPDTGTQAAVAVVAAALPGIFASDSEGYHAVRAARDFSLG
jgi:hypothetical protein